VFRSGSLTVDDLYQKPSNGASDEQLLLKSESQTAPTSWSNDERFLLYATLGLNSTFDIWIRPMEGDNKPVSWLVTPFNERSATFSPDMRWIAYLSDESGRLELYVRPFTPPGSESSATGGKWQVSKDGANIANPKWRADGKEIIFHAPDGSPMAVDVIGSAPAFKAGIPKRLFAAQPTSGPWDVTADGKRFLMAVPPRQQDPNLREPITVVMNRKTALKK